MHWLYLYFPQLQLDQYLASIESANGESTIVFNNEINEVIQCSKGARKLGIKIGMGLAEASVIYAKTTILPYSPKCEEDCLLHVATQLYNIASDIVLEPPSGIAINLSPLVRYYQGQDNFIALCHRTLHNNQVTVQFASGATIEIAQVLANASQNTVYRNNQQAFIALCHCQIALTSLPCKQVEQLHRAGIRTIKQLLDIPLEELGKRFPNTLISYVLALKGVKSSPRKTFHPSREFQQYIELPFDLEETVRVNHYLTKPLKQCCEYLFKRGRVTDELEIQLYQRESTPLCISIKSGTPHYHPIDWQALIELKLEQATLNSPITALSLACKRSFEFNGENLSLLESGYSQQAENILYGKLLAKLGDSNVESPRCINDHRLEYSSDEHTDATLSTHSIQPAWLLQPPTPLSVETHIVYGPERLQTGWWDEQPVTRDYFIAVTAQGQRLWVFRDKALQWFIHGYFA